MGKKVGKLIKEARTAADMTQEQLARKVKDCSASDISKAERGEKDLTQDQLKQIAKATGVTQSSLLNAAKEEKGKSSSSSSGKKSMQVTATEKKLLEYYRKADSEAKKAATSILKGDDDLSAILPLLLGKAKESDGLLGNLLNGAADLLKGK